MTGGSIHTHPVKINRENGKFEAKYWCTRDSWISIAGKLRGYCGKVAGEDTVLGFVE